MTLSEETRRELLRIAREAIAAAVNGRSYEAGTTPLEAQQPAGAFVTIHHNRALRGCIGQIEARQPLAAAVAQCAVSAATRDPRFPMLTARELNEGTDIEISVLTPLQPVASPEEIEVGRDGLLIQQGYRSGLLLPQVATEWGWDRDTLLAQTCRKAGLPLDAWKHGAEIYRFQAEIFSERDWLEPHNSSRP
jgi:AmmeMemoRadiSam system protein A